MPCPGSETFWLRNDIHPFSSYSMRHLSKSPAMTNFNKKARIILSKKGHEIIVNSEASYLKSPDKPSLS